MTHFWKRNDYVLEKLCNLAQINSSLNTLEALVLANVLKQIFFNDLYRSQVSITLSEAWSTLSIESIKYMQNCTDSLIYFLKRSSILLKE